MIWPLLRQLPGLAFLLLLINFFAPQALYDWRLAVTAVLGYAIGMTVRKLVADR